MILSNIMKCYTVPLHPPYMQIIPLFCESNLDVLLAISHLVPIEGIRFTYRGILVLVLK